MPNNLSEAETLSESYYDSDDADRFYEAVWGGEDIHIGIYDDTSDIFAASRKTVEAMASHLQTLGAGSRVLDLGAGYGGSARYLADRSGCSVTCLNISEVQNRRNRLLNGGQNLAQRIEVLHGSFEDVPCEDGSQDIVWSQDAFLHSGRKQRVLEEIGRVLKPGGELIFTDPMQADDCPEGVLQPVYDRLNLDSMGSFQFYRQHLQTLGFEELRVIDLTHQLRNHYANVKEQLLQRYQELTTTISTGYMDRMIAGLQNWVDAADMGYLAWGIMHFRKQAGPE